MDTQVILANGLGWSPDDRTMYFTDFVRSVIYAYDFDAESGAIPKRRPFIEIPRDAGFPDGMTVDAEGCLWVAHRDGWRVTRYGPDGRPRRTIQLTEAIAGRDTRFGGRPQHLDAAIQGCGEVGLDFAVCLGMQNVDAVLGVHIQIRHIKAFLAVADELHFGKAASRLNIAQPALSRTIQHLELMLGVQLLERTTRSVQLTEAGRSFCEHGAKILRELNLAVKCAQRTSDGNSGRLAVGYVDFALAGPVSHVFGKFKRSYPNVEIELIPESPERLTQLLIDRHIDCGFLLGPVRNANLDTRCVQSELPVVVMPVSHRLALRSKIRLKDLADEAFVLPTRNGWQPFYRRFETLSAKSGFVPNIVQEVQQTEALLAMVAAEIGIAICPASVHAFSRSGVVTQPLVGTPLLFDFHFAWHKETDSPLVSNFGALVNRFARATKPVDPARIAKLTRLGNVKQPELVDEYALVR